jgi:hypothetical protein
MYQFHKQQHNHKLCSNKVQIRLQQQVQTAALQHNVDNFISSCDFTDVKPIYGLGASKGRDGL